MKKSKLTLDTLKVKSFITTDEMRHLNGGDPFSLNDDASDGDRCHNPSDVCDSVNVCFTDGCMIGTDDGCRPTEECHTLQGCNSRTIP